jgi:hypothetical protein
MSPAPRRATTPRPGALRPRFAPTPPPVTTWPAPDSAPARGALKQNTQRSPELFPPDEGDDATEPPTRRRNVDPRRDEDRPTVPSPPPAGRAPTLDSPAPLAKPPSSAQLPRGTARALGVAGSAEAAERRAPSVLVATKDGSLARRLAAWLDPRAVVRRIRSPAALIEELADAGDLRCVVVLDCKEPSIRPIALAALADDLPASARVIVWGASDDLCAELCLISDRAASWLYTGDDVRARALADRCAELVS